MQDAEAHDREPEQSTSSLPALTTSQEELLATFETLIARTPRDGNGFLHYLLDHTHVPPDILTRKEEQQKQYIDIAKISLSMLEGYLSFNFNVPVWEKLSHEPESFYTAFHAYLQMPLRNLHELGQQLPAMTNATIHEAYILYYWEDRSRAYDILKPVAAAKLRDQRVLMAEDHHFQFSTKVLNMLGGELTERVTSTEGQRPFQGMTSKHLLEAVAQMTEMQRVSLRLPAKGPRTLYDDAHISEHASVRRSMDEAVRIHDGAESETSKAGQMKKQIEAAIASDPDRAAALQEAAFAVLNEVNAAKPDEERPIRDE